MLNFPPDPWAPGTHSPDPSAPLFSSPPLQRFTGYHTLGDQDLDEAITDIRRGTEPGQNDEYERDGNSTSSTPPTQPHKTRPDLHREPDILSGKPFPVKVFR